MNKKNISMLYILIITIISSLFVHFFIKKITIVNKLNEGVENIEFNLKKRNKETTIYFVGDIMLTRGVESSVKKNFDDNYNKLFDNLRELKNADILFGNLEGPISDKGNNVGSKYSFRMSLEVPEALSNAGFDIVSFANNHVGDWNIEAFKDTLNRLSNTQILKTGAGINKDEATSPTIIEKNGIKFGFLAFSDVGPNWIEAKTNTPGILLANDPNLTNIIMKAKEKCDVLITSFHWGEEYKTIHNKRQEELAHKAIDAGANIVIGHHPHVIEDIEYYKNYPIIYSLGNFIFDQSFSRETMRGMLLEATWKENKLKEIKNKVIVLNKKYQPEGIYDESEVSDIEELIY